jgi:hypothetical protein
MNLRKPFDLSKLAAHRARLLALGYRVVAFSFPRSCEN